MSNQSKATVTKIDKIIAALKSEGDLALLKCWEAHKREFIAKQKNDLIVARFAAFKLGQVVNMMLLGKLTNVRVLDVARNGVTIRRAATDGEFSRTGNDQKRERVSIKKLFA